MLRFRIQGTLGDTYVVVCKLLKIQDRVIVYHHTIHKYFYGLITEIYGLVKNVEVRFTNKPRYDLEELTTNCHDRDMEFFPEWKLNSKYDIKKPYMIVQPHAGKPSGGNTKILPDYMIQEILLSSPIKCVLLGTSDRFTNVGNCVNLINKTSISDAVSLIQNAEAFVGPEGLLAYVSLSSRINSTLYYIEPAAIEEKIIGTPWKKYCSSLIDMRFI